MSLIGCTFTYHLVCCRACVTVGLVLKELPTASTWWRKPRALWSTCHLNPTPWAKPLVCWFNTGVLRKVSSLCARGHSLLAFPCHSTPDSGLANFCRLDLEGQKVCVFWWCWIEINELHPHFPCWLQAFNPAMSLILGHFWEQSVWVPFSPLSHNRMIVRHYWLIEYLSSSMLFMLSIDAIQERVGDGGKNSLIIVLTCRQL